MRRSRESGGGGNKKGGAAGAALRKLEAERRSRLFFEQDRGGDYGAEDLAGLDVAAHSASVARGEELILTLADEQILHYDDAKHGKLVGLNAAADGGVLVNVRLRPIVVLNIQSSAKY